MMNEPAESLKHHLVPTVFVGLVPMIEMPRRALLAGNAIIERWHSRSKSDHMVRRQPPEIECVGQQIAGKFDVVIGLEKSLCPPLGVPLEAVCQFIVSILIKGQPVTAHILLNGPQS